MATCTQPARLPEPLRPRGHSVDDSLLHAPHNSPALLARLAAGPLAELATAEAPCDSPGRAPVLHSRCNSAEHLAVVVAEEPASKAGEQARRGACFRHPSHSCLHSAGRPSNARAQLRRLRPAPRPAAAPWRVAACRARSRGGRRRGRAP
jgi:hypothetical protein